MISLPLWLSLNTVVGLANVELACSEKNLCINPTKYSIVYIFLSGLFCILLIFWVSHLSEQDRNHYGVDVTEWMVARPYFSEIWEAQFSKTHLSDLWECLKSEAWLDPVETSCFIPVSFAIVLSLWFFWGGGGWWEQGGISTFLAGMSLNVITLLGCNLF